MPGPSETLGRHGRTTAGVITMGGVTLSIEG
jgi:hypothetical protein